MKWICFNPNLSISDTKECLAEMSVLALDLKTFLSLSLSRSPSIALLLGRPDTHQCSLIHKKIEEAETKKNVNKQHGVWRYSGMMHTVIRNYGIITLLKTVAVCIGTCYTLFYCYKGSNLIFPPIINTCFALLKHARVVTSDSWRIRV